MLNQLKSDVKTLRDPIDGRYTNLRKFAAREQRRQAFYAEACAMTPVDVEVKRAPKSDPMVAKWKAQGSPQCVWSIGKNEILKRDRQRAINWTSV